MALRFQLFRIPIQVHVFFPLTALLLAMMWQQGKDDMAAVAIFMAIVFQGVLMHELGHALVGRVFGLTPRIDLVALGGQTSWRDRGRLSPGQSLLVSFAGPAVGLVLGAPVLVWMLATDLGPGLLHDGLMAFVWINLGWSLFNLLPMQPLDGGNMMAAFFELVAGVRGRRAARYVSFAVIFALAALALFYQAVIAVVLLGLFAMQNLRGLRYEQMLDEAKENGSPMEQAHAALERGDAPVVIALASRFLAVAQGNTQRDEALHLLAWGRLLAEQPEEAQAALASMSGERDPDPALRGAVLLELGDPEAALPHLEEALAGGAGEFVERRLARAIVATEAYDEAVRIFRGPDAKDATVSAIHRVQTAIYEAGAFAQAATLGELLFQRTGRPLDAFNVACCLARLGRAEDALHWLERARDAGLRDTSMLDADADLAAVRALPAWGAFRQTFGAPQTDPA